MRLARHIDELASRTPGKEALAIESFARALRQVSIIYLSQKIQFVVHDFLCVECWYVFSWTSVYSVNMQLHDMLDVSNDA